MADEPASLRTEEQGDGWVLAARGSWQLANCAALDAQLRGLDLPRGGRARIDVSGVDSLDGAGAWLLVRTRNALRGRGVAAEIAGARDSLRGLLDRFSEIDQQLTPEDVAPVRYRPLTALIDRMGRVTIRASSGAVSLTGFMGATVIAFLLGVLRPQRLRLVPLMVHIERTGLNALPIVGLINFLIGIVLAYMGATQLATFGAEIFAVDLVGIGVLREMGILLTAIIVAGRSGSAFTAQIGTMKVSQEIDAMRTIGIDPMQALVLPRTLALMISLPLLTFFADIMGLLGGLIMLMLVDVATPVQFLDRTLNAVGVDTFLVGLVKAPVFAATIAVVGCYEGLKVGGSAESVGAQTTRSVVESIFLVIVFDAAFAVMFSYLGI